MLLENLVMRSLLPILCQWVQFVKKMYGSLQYRQSQELEMGIYQHLKGAYSTKINVFDKIVCYYSCYYYYIY